MKAARLSKYILGINQHRSNKNNKLSLFLEGRGGTQPFTLGNMRIFKVSDMYTLVDSQELIIITTKTEILRVGDEHIEKEYIIVDEDGNEVISKSIEAIKVCGMWYNIFRQ